MASEIIIKFKIDGIEREVSSVAELEIELSKLDKTQKNVSKSTSDASTGLKETAKATKDLGTAAQKTDKEVGFIGEKLNGLKDTFSKLKGDAKGVAEGFMKFSQGLGFSEKASKGLAVGLSALGIPLLLAGLAAIIDYFKNFEAGAKLVQTALNVVGAVVGQLTKAFSALINLDFSGAAAAIGGIGDAASSAVKGTDALFASARALEKLQQESTVTNAKLKQSIELQQKVLEDTTQTFETRMAALKSINKDTEQLAINEVNLATATLTNLKAQLLLEKNYEKRIELEQQIADTQADLIDKQTAVQVIQFEANKKERELQAERTAKAAEEAAKRVEIEKQFQEQLRSSRQNAELLRIKDEDERAKRKLELDRENAIREIKQSEFNTKQKNALIKAINADFDLQESERVRTKAEKDAAEKKKKDEEDLAKAKEKQLKLSEILTATDLALIENAQFKAQEELRIAEEKQMAELVLLGATEEQKTKVAKLFGKKREDLAKEEAKVKIELEKKVREANVQIVSDAFGAIAGLVGENTIAFKAASVAQATIDTYLAAQKAYTSQLIPGDPTSPVRAGIASAVAIAAGISNVQKILTTPVPGGGGGGGTAPSAPSVPQFNPEGALAENAVGGFAFNETGVEQRGSGTQTVVRAFVVASDMTSQQEANKKILDLIRL